jgi:hypothetical protein
MRAARCPRYGSAFVRLFWRSRTPRIEQAESDKTYFHCGRLIDNNDNTQAYVRSVFTALIVVPELMGSGTLIHQTFISPSSGVAP